MKRAACPALVALLVLGSSALAAPRGSADVVKAAPAAKVVTAAPGARVSFTITVDIAATWHLYAHGDTNFIGIDLVPAEDFPLSEFAAEYPEGHLGEFFGEQVRMLEGANVIKASALVPAGMTGEQPLELGLTVQACDTKTCLAPATVPVALTLKVE
ncbi:MAG TPA: protein-disulfide reductase DsbD family protein [Candidatus Krumholzibacteria bacterium]|nr:protein-disulfide reductase DsbD family protein [Candidatus Krumholzibacteria bacterium]